MAISQRTRTLGTAASGAGFTVSFPSGAATGDLLILVVANAGTAAPAAPTGWTRFYSASAGTGQNVAVFSAPYSGGLTGSFTNAASVAAWACNAFLSSDTGEQVEVDASTAATNTTNNTTLPTGAPTSGGVAGDYEVLCYGWTSAATITSTASGSTIDGTQANGSSVSAAIGHNNTASISASTTPTAFSHTLSASNTRKTGVGVLLRETRSVQRAGTPVTVSISETRRKARVSWIDLFVPLAASTLTRTATPVTASLSTSSLARAGAPITAALSSASVTRTATPTTVAMQATLTRTATPTTVSLSTVATTPRRARLSWLRLQLPDAAAIPTRTATPITAAVRGTVTRTATTVRAALSGAASFAAAVSSTGRYLVDQYSAPYFIQGNSPQCIIARLTATEQQTFLVDQAARGINSSQIHLVLTNNGGMGGNANGSDASGNVPFSSMSTLSGPLEPYWLGVDALFDLAALNGCTLWATAIDDISIGDTIDGMTTGQCFTLGQFLGNRYKTRSNLVWTFGNDWQPGEWTARDAKYQQILAGIQSTGDTHLVTTWLNYTDSTSWDLATWDALHDVVLEYSYTLPYYQAERAWSDTSSTAPQPTFFGEGNYEGEHLFPSFGEGSTTDLTLRRTAWWPVTWGACGTFFGQHNIWQFLSDWASFLNTTAPQEFARVATLMRSIDWWLLAPDLAHQLVTSGYGTHNTSEDTDPLDNDFATAAISTDRRLAVVYVPSRLLTGGGTRPWVIETTALIGNVRGFWLDPTTGTRTTATAPWAIPTTTHSDGSSDWVLVLDSTGRTASPVTVSLFLQPRRTATPVTVALVATPTRTGAPVSVSLQGSSTRTSQPLTVALSASSVRRTATPTTVALAALGTRAGTPTTAALSASGLRRTATPITASVQSSFSRGALPITAALIATPVSLGSPITVSLSRVRAATPVSAALARQRTATPVTATLSTTLLARTATPTTAALSASSLTRTATPVTVALQAAIVIRTATPTSVALQSSPTRTATPTTVALSGAATARLATPVTAVLQSTGTRTATPLAVALQSSITRLGGSVTVSLIRSRTARPVTVSLSSIAGTRIAHPVSVALEGAAGLPPTRTLTARGRAFGTSTGRRTGLTVREDE